MIKLSNSQVWVIAVLVACGLATSGCATKKYVRQQVNPVNQRVSQVETQTNEQISSLSSKEQSDISQVNERISTTDLRVAQVATSTQQAQATASQAQGTASRAMEETESNRSRIASNSASIDKLGAGVANALNFQLVETGDVTFGLNQSKLGKEAKIALDVIVMKVQALPRSAIELSGFADRSGSQNYNLDLSRRRAQSVQRYLVQKKVPLRDIHIVGLGEEAAPENLKADLQTVDPNPSKAEVNRLARRVRVRVFGAGDVTTGSASRIQQ